MAKAKDFAYGGKYHEYCWDPIKNPNATITNGLANCTTLAFAYSFINKLPSPVSRIGNANVWDRLLTNGWSVRPYGSTTIKKGDIIQWVANCHVATVIGVNDGEPWLACSWYTGEHGQSVYEGSMDTRADIYSLQQLSDFMIENYPYRFYHECSLSEESMRVGGLPENILVAPITVDPVEKDTSRDQIQVLTNEQNIRDDDGNIVGVAQSGYYNVLGTKEQGGYVWYMVKKNRWIAGVNGRVVFIPSADIEALKEENDMLRRRLKEISKLTEI